MPYKNKEDQLACQRRHYANNKQQYLDKNKRKKGRLKATINKYKENNPCMDCKQFFPACVMDFDHIGDKLKNVSALVASGQVQAANEEISKCELVCANCHRIRTWKRRSGVV